MNDVSEVLLVLFAIIAAVATGAVLMLVYGANKFLSLIGLGKKPKSRRRK